jgi:outer membrane protein TolC
MKFMKALRNILLCGCLCMALVTAVFSSATPAEENGTGKIPEARNISLEQAIQMALENNRTLRSAALDITSSDLSLKSQQSEFDIKIVPQGASRYDSGEDGYWQVGATLSKKLAQGAEIAVTPTTGESGGSRNSEVDVSLRIPLLQGAGSAYAMDAVYSSMYSNEKEKLSFIKQQTDTILQTVTAVYGCIQTQQQIDFLQKQLDELKRHLSLAKIKEKSGIIDAMDLYRAEIRIQSVEEELTSTREELANNIDEVKNILAVSLQQPLIVTAPVDYRPVEIELEEAQNIALANRIELVMSAMQLQESERRVAVAKNNILPQLDLELGYNSYRDEDYDAFSDERWTVALSSESDLFRTSERNDYQQSRLELQQVELSRQDVEEQIIQDVRFQLNSLEKQQERIAIRQEQARQAMGKLRLAESKFRYSLANNFDLLEAQTEMQQARTDYMVETINYIVGTYRLRSSLGTLMDIKGETKVNR